MSDMSSSLALASIKQVVEESTDWAQCHPEVVAAQRQIGLELQLIRIHASMYRCCKSVTRYLVDQNGEFNAFTGIRPEFIFRFLVLVERAGTLNQHWYDPALLTRWGFRDEEHIFECLSVLGELYGIEIDCSPWQQLLQ